MFFLFFLIIIYFTLFVISFCYLWFLLFFTVLLYTCVLLWHSHSISFALLQFVIVDRSNMTFAHSHLKKTHSSAQLVTCFFLLLLCVSYFHTLSQDLKETFFLTQKFLFILTFLYEILNTFLQLFLLVKFLYFYFKQIKTT